MYESFLSLVRDSQMVIDAIDLALVFGELEDFSSEDLQESLEDMFFFYSDSFGFEEGY